MVAEISINWKKSHSNVISNEATKVGFIHALMSDCLQRLEVTVLRVKLLISEQDPYRNSYFTNYLQVFESKPYLTINVFNVFVI